LLEDKRRAYEAHLDDPTSTAKKDALRNMSSTIQLKLRQMQGSGLEKKLVRSKDMLTRMT